jgi:DAK2 domain fusion protein YloV
MAKASQNAGSAEIKVVEKVISIDGVDLKKLLQKSLLWLKNHQSVVNALNVFPVPDGDTGTNMYLTMQSALKEIENSTEKNIGKVSHQVAQGALMGARGNSGVILSQLLRGFARALDHEERMDASLLNKAFAESRNTAYKGVVKPVEGTILTVSKDIASASEDLIESETDLVAILGGILEAGEVSLDNTPNLLPILKQAGVVDSGGKGLLIILEGIYRAALGETVDIGEVQPDQTIINLDQINQNGKHEEIEPGQDFEVVVDFSPKNDFDLKHFYGELEKIGTSIQVGEGDDFYRMHIHVATDKKYEPIEKVGEFGIVQKIYIENLLEQLEQRNAELDFSNTIEDGQTAVISVSPGNGISKIFQSLGVAKVISGGQTMNPSTNEIFDAFKELPTENVIILPNNKNIIMAAEAAKKLSNKNVVVIPTTSIPQGMVACLQLDPMVEFADLVDDMKTALAEVDTGEITTATRSIDINGVNVKKGEVISLLNGKLVSSSKSIKKSCEDLLKQANTEEKEHITIFYGLNADNSLVDEITTLISNKYPDHELEVHNGGQPHYQFILAIE